MKKLGQHLFSFCLFLSFFLTIICWFVAYSEAEATGQRRPTSTGEAPAPNLKVTVDGRLLILSWASVPEATSYKVLFASFGGANGYAELDVGSKTAIALDFDRPETLKVFEKKIGSGNLREGLGVYVAVQPYEGSRTLGLSNVEYAILGGEGQDAAPGRKQRAAAPPITALGVTREALTLPVREVNPCTGLNIPCVDQYTLCLLNGRFQVRINWVNYNDNTTGRGIAIHLSGDSGYFWFFSDTNIEVVVAMLNGCAVNGNFWVKYGALTDVEYHMTVTDTVTGRVKTYDNPAHNLASVIDIFAFSGACSTPTTPRAGFWQGPNVEFYVTPAGTGVALFKGLGGAVPVCGFGSFTLRLNGTVPITNNAFSYSESGFSFNGNFGTAQTATGMWGLNNFTFSNGCVASYGPVQWTAQWINGTQPPISLEVAQPDRTESYKKR